MNDIVYIVGKGSTWNDNELKYSLRSLEMHAKDFRNVVIIGHAPGFINREEVFCIDFIETQSMNPALNIMHKVKHAARAAEVSENFMLMNDDYFLNAPVSATSYPYYFKNHLLDAMQINSHNDYMWHLKATYNVLDFNKLPTLNYDTHCPIIFNSERLIKVVEFYNWEGLKHGYTLRSLYCNSLLVVGTPHEDLKMNRSRFEGEILKLIEGKDCFSVGDKGLNKSMQNVIKQLYPNKSRYEK